MKKLYFVAVSIFALSSVLASAQTFNPRVEVENTYEGKIIEAGKQVLPMSVPDSLYKFQYQLDYSVFDNPYRGSYHFQPYKIEMKPDAVYHEGRGVWVTKVDIALPCATQNELTIEDAEILVENGVLAVCEGANMPTTLEATAYLQEKGVPREVAEELLETTPPDEEAQILRELRKRRFDPEHADLKERKRTAAFLMRKGYSWAQIESALRTYETGEEVSQV